jgi:hypothetical protein
MKSEPHPTPEFQRFNKMMGGLLAVSHDELQAELAKEKKQKARKKKRAKTSPASRASSGVDR